MRNKYCFACCRLLSSYILSGLGLELGLGVVNPCPNPTCAEYCIRWCSHTVGLMVLMELLVAVSYRQNRVVWCGVVFL